MQNKSLALIGALLAAATSQAAIISTGGSAVLNMPSSVVPGVVQGPNINVFTEKTSVLLGSSLSLDHVNTGTVNAPASLVGGSVAAGTLIDSYFVHYDPANSANASGVVRFSTPILGVMVNNAAFNASHSALGNGAVAYGTATGAYGLELSANADRFSISPDRKVLEFRFSASNPGDRIRVVTQAVPEPGTLAAAGIGFAAFLRKRRKA